MKVFPVINCENFECLKKRLSAAVTLFSDADSEDRWIHVDISDGQFVPAHSWDSVEEFAEIAHSNPDIKFEIHLMVKNPEGVTDSYLRAGAKRVVVQLESMTDSVYILEKCKKYGAEAMLSIMPPTEVERLLAHQDDFGYFQILAVSHGYPGQPFQPAALEKIKFLRENIPDAIIEVDGGINAETAKLVKNAGADIIVSGSYILGNNDPVKSYKLLKNI